MTIKNNIKIILLFLIFIGTSCNKDHLKPIIVKRNFSGSIWVVRHYIADAKKIDSILKAVEGTDIKNIFVQVRGRGDAYYDSAIEPVADDVETDFDPLKYFIDKTRRSDIKIHAWVNISYILNPQNYPPSAGHILHKHPEWVTYDYKGRPITDYSAEELKSNLLEGYFLDPALPEVKEYINAVVRDLLSKYPVDGLHLDFIRYPYSGYNSYYHKYLSDFGYNPEARKIFSKRYGIDPITIPRKGDSREKKLFDEFRREQITDIVRMLGITSKRINPEITISAAVMPRYDRGREVYFQDWPLWLKKGYLDLACIMSYTSRQKTFDKYMKYAAQTGMRDKIFMGIRVKKNTPISTAQRQIRSAYNKGFRGYIIFSFKHEEDFLEDLTDSINYRRYIFKLY